MKYQIAGESCLQAQVWLLLICIRHYGFGAGMDSDISLIADLAARFQTATLSHSWPQILIALRDCLRYNLSMIAILLIVLFCMSLYWAHKTPGMKRWFIALSSTLVVGAITLLLDIYYGAQTNCGAKYDPDLGCSRVLPSWWVSLGLGMLLLSVLLSVAALYLSFKRSKST